MEAVNASYTTHHGFNLREFSHHSERAATVLSLVSNTVLVMLLLREKNEVMKPYNRVLLQNCLVDYFYTIVSGTVEIHLEMNQGVYIFVVNGFLKHLPAPYHYAQIGAWMFSFSLTLIICPVEFFFRYMLVCKGKMLSTWQLTGLACCCAVLAASLGATIVSALVATSDHKATFGHLMQDPLWFDDGKQVVFFGADSRHSPMLITFLALASSYDAAIYIIIMVTGLAVYRSIKEASKYMSAKTKYMQSQMNRVLFAEAGSVTVVGVIPVAIAMYMLVFRLTHVGLGIWLTVLFAWIPIVNPITTIFLVAPYRRQLFGRIARALCKNSSYMSKWSSMEARSQSKVAPMSQMGSQIRTSPISNGVH